MKKIVAFLLIFIPVITFGQDHLLGETKEFILNTYKDKDCSVTSVNDSSMSLKYTDDGEIVFRFENNLCCLIALTCDEDTKNFFIATYVEVGAKVDVEKRERGTVIVFTYAKKLIKIFVPKVNETESYLIVMQYQ